MNNGAKTVLGILSILLVLSGIWGGVLPALAVDSPDVSGQERLVAAKVNGASIYEDQLDSQMNASLGKFSESRREKISSDLLKQKRQQVLDQLINATILQQASLAGMTSDMERVVDARINEFKQGRYASKFAGKSEAEIREWVRGEILMEKYLDENGLTDPVIPEADIKAYYEENRGSFTAKESIRVRHILVKVEENASPSEKEAAFARIEKIRGLVAGGADFAELAREYSDCASSVNGGDLGNVEKGFMPPEFDQVAFSIEPKKLSEAVRTKYGYHLLEVTEKNPGGVVPYDERVRSLIRKYLQGERKRQMLAAHIQELRARAKIEIVPR